MDFERAFRRFKKKSATTSWEGALDLSRCRLSQYPDRWEEIFEGLKRLEEHRPLERALAAIGEPIEKLLRRHVEADPEPSCAPLLRVLGNILGQNGKALYLSFQGAPAPLWGAALECIAEFDPGAAENLASEAVRSTASGLDRKHFAVALARCGSPKTLALIREYGLTDVSNIFDELSRLDDDRFERLLSFAEIELAQSDMEHLPWPLSAHDFHFAVANRRTPATTRFLELLTDAKVWWVSRDAIAELARRGNAKGLKLLRDRALSDRVLAEVAVEVAFSLGPRVPFDWFARAFFLPPAESFENPLNMVKRRVLERIAGTPDLRWRELAIQLAPIDPKLATLLRVQLTSESIKAFREQLLSTVERERNSALIKLGELKDVLVLPWIKSRVESEDALSREEYFAFIESMRQLGNPDGIPIIERLMRRCPFTGYAGEFAKETIEVLAD